MKHRSVVEKLDLPSQLVVELPREVRLAPFHQVPLVRGDDDAGPGLLGFAGDRRILVRRAFYGVDDHHGHVRLLYCPPGENDADVFELTGAGDLPRAPNSRRIDNPEFPLMPAEERIDAVAGGPGHVADDRALFPQQSIQKGGLADIGAADNRDRDFLGVGVRAGLAPGWQTLDYLVEQVPGSQPMLGGNLDDWLEAQAIELGRGIFRPAIVGLVDGDEHRDVRRTQAPGDLLVGRHQAFPAIHNKDNEIGGRQRLLSLRDDERVQRIVARPKQASRVDERKRRAQPLRGKRLGVARGPWYRRDDRASRARNSIE